MRSTARGGGMLIAALLVGAAFPTMSGGSAQAAPTAARPVPAHEAAGHQDAGHEDHHDQREHGCDPPPPPQPGHHDDHGDDDHHGDDGHHDDGDHGDDGDHDEDDHTGSGSGSGTGTGHTPDSLAFAISGDVPDVLTPGGVQSVDLRLTNPNPTPIVVTALQVAAGPLDAAHAGDCVAADNFAVTPFTGDLSTLVIPASSSRLLSELGVPVSQWPTAAFVLTDQDQTSCLGAVLTLSYAGIAKSAR